MQRKSTSGYPGCTQHLNSSPLQCWLCRLCKLIVFCKSSFQLSVTSKVLKNKGATKKAYHSLYSTFEPPLHFSVGCVACANSLPFAATTNTVGELCALCETTINAIGCVLDGLCVLKDENIYLDVFDNVCKNNWCALPSLKGKNQRSRLCARWPLLRVISNLQF